MNLKKAFSSLLFGVVIFLSSCASNAAASSHKIKIITSSLPPAIAGQSYSQQLAASGGTGSYFWSLASGALPPGITLSGSGVISGRPISTGQFTFVIQVTDLKTLAGARVEINLKG